MVCPLSKWVNFHVLGIGHVFQDGIMRLLRKIKYILVAGAAGGVLASYLVVHPSICEAPFEEKKKEDPGLFIHQKPRSKWDANWDRWTFSCQYHFSSCLYQQSGNVFFFFFRGGPHSLLKPSKSAPADSEKIEKVKPTATRNLILIRHGQYNLSGVKDEERYLTALGILPLWKQPTLEVNNSRFL